MVRLIPVEKHGKIVWREDAPTHCPAGHEDPRPGWGPCPDCGFAMRYWLCGTAGCGAKVWDDDHVHGQPLAER